MAQSRTAIAAGALALCTFSLLGCEQKPAKGLAPSASALEKPAPSSASQAFEIDSASSKVDFSMAAELERISGRAPGALQGQLFVDLRNITNSSGLVKLDLDKLSIYQQKRERADGEFSPETRNEKQNTDMRTWFEIESDAPPAVRESNRWAEFKLSKVVSPSVLDLAALGQKERSLTATVTGDFRLHGRVKQRSAKLDIKVEYAGERARTLHARTLTPIAIELEEHDVRPRSAFSKLADKTLDALGAKVAKVAMVSLEFSANAR